MKIEQKFPFFFFFVIFAFYGKLKKTGKSQICVNKRLLPNICNI